MSGPEITELLQQLHGALEKAPSLGEKDRELLRRLSQDIQGLLAEPGGAEPATVIERLREAVVRFEVTHPDITSVLAGVSKALGDMGI